MEELYEQFEKEEMKVDNRIHFNNSIESNILLCGKLKLPNKLVWRAEEESLYSDDITEVTCRKCKTLKKNLTTAST